MKSAFQKAWKTQHRLQWRLTGLVIALLAVGLSLVGLIQYGLLRQYVIGQAAEPASVAAAAAAKGRQSGSGSSPDATGSLVAIYDSDLRMVSAPAPPPPGKSAARWQSPPQPLLAAAASALRNPGKESTSPWQASLFKFFGLGSLNGPAPNQQVFSEPDGEILLTVVPLNSDAGAGFLATETSLAGADAAVHADAVIFTLAAASTLIITAMLAIWLTAHYLAPLDRVSVVADAIKSGAYEQRIGLRGEDQVGKLATAFDEMVDRLQGQIELVKESEATTRRFIADASHELRNPMAALLGNLEVAQRAARVNAADLERSLSATHTAARQLARMLQDLLEVARLDQPEFSLRLDRVDMPGILARSARIADGSSEQRVTVECGAGPLVVLGDQDALERIVVNLIDNAGRYSAAGTPVRVRAQKSADGHIEVSVTDQGPGIIPEEQERIFERLYRGRGAGSTPGTGLGLAISRGLARRLGGDVFVRSVPGRGSTFVLRLPSAPVSGPVKKQNDPIDMIQGRVHLGR